MRADRPELIHNFLTPSLQLKLRIPLNLEYATTFSEHHSRRASMRNSSFKENFIGVSLLISYDTWNTEYLYAGNAAID